jgi:hypothetical protein
MTSWKGATKNKRRAPAVSITDTADASVPAPDAKASCTVTSNFTVNSHRDARVCSELATRVRMSVVQTVPRWLVGDKPTSLGVRRRRA